MKSKMLGLLTVALLAGPMAAQVEASTVTFPTAPSPFVLNFDLTGTTPGPSFDSVEVFFNPTVGLIVGGYFCRITSNLDGLGTETGFCADALALGEPVLWIGTGQLDGIFSVRFSAPNGMTYADPCAVGIRGGVRTSCILGTAPGARVPEPDTLALLGLGLAGLGLSRRRKA